MYDVRAGLVGVVLVTVSAMSNAAAAQDGPVLAPPSDTRPTTAPAEASSPRVSPANPSPERRSQLRRLFRPRTPGLPMPTDPTAGVVSSDRVPPNPGSSLEFGSPVPAPASGAREFGSDPLGLEPLPADLELLPAAPAATSISTPPVVSALPEAIDLEVSSNYDDAPPLLGAGEVDSTNLAPKLNGLPDPFEETDSIAPLGDPITVSENASTRSARATRRKPSDLDAIDEEEDDRQFERDLRKSLINRLGRQARDIDVRVNGDSINVRVNVNFFWNRRGVRRTIESLPDLAGYDVTIDTY